MAREELRGGAPLWSRSRSRSTLRRPLSREGQGRHSCLIVGHRTALPGACFFYKRGAGAAVCAVPNADREEAHTDAGVSPPDAARPESCCLPCCCLRDDPRDCCKTAGSRFCDLCSPCVYAVCIRDKILGPAPETPRRQSLGRDGAARHSHALSGPVRPGRCHAAAVWRGRDKRACLGRKSMMSTGCTATGGATGSNSDDSCCAGCALRVRFHRRGAAGFRSS